VNKTNAIIILIAVLFLSACGYHLAGKADLDPVFENTHVTYQGLGQRTAELVMQQLKVNEISLVSKEDASSIVTILYENTDREILAVDENGKVSEYELILLIGINVKNADGVNMIKDQTIRLSRGFLFDINDVLGKAREEQVIYQEMRRDAARLIIYRLQAVSSDV